MRNGKKIGLFLIILMLGALLLAGCGKNGQGESTKTKQITGAADLSGAIIGVQTGTTGADYAAELENDGQGTKVERYNKGADAIQALKLGKIDCVVIDEQPAIAFVNQNSNIRILDEEFVTEEYAFCIAKENTELLEQVNAALSQLREDGTLQNIIKNYIGSDEELGQFPYERKEVERTNGTLVVGTNAEFPPYEYYENNQITGLDIDIMYAVSDILGMDVQIEDMAFDSVIAAVTSGKVNIGASGFTITEDRKKNINFTDSYITSRQVIIVKDGDSEAKASLREKFYDNFIKDNRYQYIVKGLGNTLIITILAVILGIIGGFLIAIVRTNHDRNGGLTILNFFCRIYLTVIRGTPVMIQLLIIYYVILASATNKIMVAAIAFGLNSAAYVAEIVRSGIMSVDMGQFEAGRSLGLGYKQTMIFIVLPQAVKNILPALLNEVISLLKETSISGYIGLMDLTKGGDIIRGNTYEAFLPLLAVAVIYLTLVMLLSFGVSKLERRLRNNER